MNILQECKYKPRRLATSLLILLFSKEELLEDVNVNGKVMNGAPSKKALDPKRMQIIKTFCLDGIISEMSNKVWKACTDAIHKKLYINRNNLKENIFNLLSSSFLHAIISFSSTILFFANIAIFLANIAVFANNVIYFVK
jgi:hypothetical protein